MAGRTFLFELGTEELPPKALDAMSRALADGLAAALGEAHLAFASIERFATPRRLAALVHGLAPRQPDREVEKRGPPVRVAFDADGRPTRAALAFADGAGVAVDALDRVSTPKGEWLVHRTTEAGRAAGDVLAELLPGVVDTVPVPRRMRWGSGEAAFSRPVRWVVALLDEEIVDCTVLGCRSGRRSFGHRFHGPAGGLDIDRASGYAARLLEARVVARFDERRDQVRTAIHRTAADAGAQALVDDALLDEVTALVELPVPVLAGFDERFLALPREVIVATLQDHQRYFPLTDRDGALRAQFVTIANIDSREPDEVRRGNERVVQPRLADAAFFWETDGARRLDARCADLAKVVFQAELGTLADKTERLETIAAAVCEALGEDAAATRRAALLAKTDLLTDMVGEFPELQGVMGRHYATRDGEPAAVATALEEQYLPRFAGDRLPATTAGRALALADRLDTLAGCFAIGARPTGNRDPFGLRRGALGVLRILIEGELDIDLRALLVLAASRQPVLPAGGAEALAGEVEAFVMERLRGYYLAAPATDGGGAGESEAGAAAEPLAQSVFEAVLAVRPSRPFDFDRRLRAVREFAALDAAAALAAANKRISNILRQAEADGADGVDPRRLEEPAEVALHEAVEALRGDVEQALEAGHYTEAMTRLASLRDAVDAFFDGVMVITDDERLRRNRLALLAELRGLFTRTADISLLQHGAS